MCVFCKIAKGLIPSYKIYEDENFIAFLDLSQATIGHTLVIPKKHYSNFLDADLSTINKVYTVSSKVAHALKNALNINDFNILTNCGEKAGQTIDHFHVHIIPRYTNNDLSIVMKNNTLSSEELTKIANNIHNSL